jgi:hypothetical protein
MQSVLCRHSRFVNLVVDLFINIVAGTECVREDGSYGWILFDPMTHTVAGYATC